MLYCRSLIIYTYINHGVLYYTLDVWLYEYQNAHCYCFDLIHIYIHDYLLFWSHITCVCKCIAIVFWSYISMYVYLWAVIFPTNFFWSHSYVYIVFTAIRLGLIYIIYVMLTSFIWFKRISAKFGVLRFDFLIRKGGMQRSVYHCISLISLLFNFFLP